MKNQIVEEIEEAFSDCWMKSAEDAMRRRNLDFRASGPLKPSEWLPAMRKIIPHGYNEFCVESIANTIAPFADRIEIVMAREGSPAMYFQADKKTLKLLENVLRKSKGSPDELTLQNDELRAWWD